MNKRKSSGSVIFDLVLNLIADLSWAELEEIAEAAEVSVVTLYFWQQGVVESPLVANIERVLAALNFAIHSDGEGGLIICERATIG